MASAPDSLTFSRHRDRRGHRRDPWIRRAGLTLLALIVLFALLNYFGQRPATSTASAAAARLQLYAPATVRGGLLYTARLRTDARKDIKKAILVFAPGWADQYTFNGVSPQPISEGSANGKVSFTLGHIRQGKHYTLFVSLQVNPTNVGHHGQTGWLYDSHSELAAIHHEITIWP
jgi:hypothetical protein